MQRKCVWRLLFAVFLLVSNTEDKVVWLVTESNSGSTEAYCGKGCQTGFGDCVQNPKSSSVSRVSTSSTTLVVSPSTRTSVSSPSSTLKITTNARCGKEGTGRTCKGSKWGNCCSQYSYVSGIPIILEIPTNEPSVEVRMHIVVGAVSRASETVKAV
jgi:hypothetical protein